jgi:hypothetical protein
MSSIAITKTRAELGVGTRVLLTAGFLVLGLALPQVITHIPVVGSMLSPMHIPVLLCGLVCGWGYAGALGLALPMLSAAIFGMPPVLPIGLAMSLELATYGVVIALVYARLQKNLLGVLVSLLAAMVAGRLVYGLASLIIVSLMGNQYTFAAFWNGTVLNAWPAIVSQLVLIPAIMLVLQRTKVAPRV